MYIQNPRYISYASNIDMVYINFLVAYGIDNLIPMYYKFRNIQGLGKPSFLEGIVPDINNDIKSILSLSLGKFWSISPSVANKLQYLQDEILTWDDNFYDSNH